VLAKTLRQSEHVIELHFSPLTYTATEFHTTQASQLMSIDSVYCTAYDNSADTDSTYTVNTADIKGT